MCSAYFKGFEMSINVFQYLSWYPYKYEVCKLVNTKPTMTYFPFLS